MSTCWPGLNTVVCLEEFVAVVLSFVLMLLSRAISFVARKWRRKSAKFDSRCLQYFSMSSNGGNCGGLPNVSSNGDRFVVVCTEEL